MLTKQHPTVSQSPYAGFNRSPSLQPPSYTTDDLASARYIRHARALEWLRIAFSAITLVAGIAITACAGVSLHLFDDTHVAAEWMLPLWPMNVDLRPTRATLATGIVVMLFSLGYIVLAFAPLRSKARVLNLAGGAMALLSFILTLFTTIFVAVITNNLATSQSSGSLVSWTCKWQSFSSVAPDGFNQICDNGAAAYDLVLLLVVLEFIGVAMAGAGFFVEKKLQKSERGRGISKVELV